MLLTLDQIAECTQAELINGSDQIPIQHICIDSRSIVHPSSTLFVAIKGNRHDGHEFIAALYESGVRAFLVSNKIPFERYPKATFFRSDNVIESLQRVAIYHRNQFDIATIGITGSNGKTTIKEWLFQLLNPEFHIVKSPKSYNSQIGVALSVLNMDPAHELGIFEGGISQIGEMEKIAPIIDCTFGIFTNIGTAHDEGFASLDIKIDEKALLFTNAKAIICCKDQERVFNRLKSYYPQKLITWSLHDRKSDLYAQHESGQLKLFFQGQEGTIDLPFTDQASVENILHCISMLLHLKYDFTVINQRLAWLKRLPLRLELVNGSRDNLIINDCYNADIESFSLALDFMDQQAAGRRKTIILSDVHQMAGDINQLYARIAKRILGKKIERVITIGSSSQLLRNLLGQSHANHFNSTDELIAKIGDLHFENEIILLKGARQFELERISNLLQSQSHAAQLEVDIDALLSNLSYYQSIIPSGTKTMVMVKAAAYGGGSTEISSILQYHNLDYVGVAYADEGIELRRNGIHLPILILNPDWSYLDLLYRHRLEPEVYSLEGLKAIVEYQNSTNNILDIHFKVDTGMNRLGFAMTDIPKIIKIIKSNLLQVKSIFSHISAGDDPEMDNFSQSQFDKFHLFYKKISDRLGYAPLRHILNSVGILRHPDYSYEMVRLGKGIYGIDLPREYQSKFGKVHQLKARISQIKQVPLGSYIGYNAKSSLKEEKRIATVNIGYADGVMRSAGNGTCSFLVKNQLAPTIGNICMDMFMMDITNLKEIKVGDTVEIFGQNLPIESISAQMGTIPLELLCGISRRVRRVYFRS